MDIKVKHKIEHEFPYPIALEFRRLNTEEFLDQNEKRLQKLLRISENTIHFLALIGLVDLFDNLQKFSNPIPDWFSKEFAGRFTRTSFGKWIALFRDTVRIFKNENFPMFIPELADYFIKGKSSESEAQKAFNNLTTMRNRLAHDASTLTRADLKTFCVEAEEYLDILISNLVFLADYTYISVGGISVNYPKNKEPQFIHTFSEVIGTSSEFSASKKTMIDLLNSPSVIITKPNCKDYLNLDPLIIVSNEGAKQIHDIFMYVDWDSNKTIKYRPVWNGGDFNLIGTERETEQTDLLLKFWESFSDIETYNKYIPKPKEITKKTEQEEFVKFQFED